MAHQDRAYPNRIDAEVRVRIRGLTQDGGRGLLVDHSFAVAWDAGVLLASRRSWWRIAHQITDQSQRPVVATKKDTRQPRQVPVLVVTRSGQVWSWVITNVKATWLGKTFKTYSIIDIFSHPIVGYRVEEREVDVLAVEMFETAIGRYRPPGVVHADSEAAMKSNVLKKALTDRGVAMTHNRPYVSNDNPFSESEFRTMKYRPNYPSTFEAVETARVFIDGYVDWYNAEHRYSGIAYFTPSQVHDGSWGGVWVRRQHALDD